MIQEETPDLVDRLAQSWRGYVLVALIALLGALPGIARFPIMDRDEARYVQATTQMLETGDYVRMMVQDEPRHKKPIGIHWMQAASVAAFGGLVARENYTYRFPSLLGAIAAACAAFWAGGALLPKRTALIGAGLFGAGLLLGMEGMTAKTDAVQCAFTTLTLGALAWLYAKPPPNEARRLSLVFWAALGGGILIKGPVAPMVAGLALAALFLWERRAAWMRPLAWWPSPVLAALIVLPWMIAIWIETDGDYFREAFTVDFAPKVSTGAEGHTGPFGYNLALLPLLIFPATFALPGAARLIWRTARAPRTDEALAPIRFFLCWAAPSFLVFELVATKLPHYVLPTYPAIALIAAAGIERARAEGWRVTNAIGVALFAAAAAALVALCALATQYMPGDAFAAERRALQSAMMGAFLVLPALGALTLLRRDHWRAAIAIVLALGVSFALRERIIPEARRVAASEAVSAALARANLHPRLSLLAPPLWVIGYGETSLVFETRTDVHIAAPWDAGREAELGDAVVLEAREAARFREELAARDLVFTPIGPPVEALNYANGDEVSLQVGLIARAP